MATKKSDLVVMKHEGLSIPDRIRRHVIPAVIGEEGKQVRTRFLEFFTAQIRNKNTRLAYLTAVHRFFDWCRERSFTLQTITPMAVALYIETHPGSPPTVGQHLAAIRMLFDWLVTGQVVPFNPAASVRGPKHGTVNNAGKTPILTARQMRAFLDSIDTSTLLGLRDRALIGLMVFSFARVSAAVQMRVKDYYHQGDQAIFRLHEKGGKYNKVPAHHTARVYLDEYIEAAGIIDDRKGPLFRACHNAKTPDQLSGKAMNRQTAVKMVKKRARVAGFPEITCHSFRGTGITAYLKSGGTLENAAAIAGHASTRTTQLYNRTREDISQEEINRIVI